MKILKRDKKSKKWMKVDQKEYENEAELQDLLYEDPSIIPVQEIGENRKPVKVAIKEYGLPGTGSSDIIGVDEDGNITIIEAKLAVNPDVKRKVIGQILEYAAFLWRKTYEQFDGVVQAKKGRPLLDLMSDLVTDGDWSEEEFRREISNNLYNGEFSLFIVVDDIDDDLKRILEFINSRSFSGPQIYAFAARYFRDKKGDELLVPQIYGASIKETEVREQAERKYKKWDRDKFLDHARERLSEAHVFLLSRIYEFFERVGQVRFGTGFETGTFGLAYKDSPSIWTVDTKGVIRLGLGWLYNRENISKEKLIPLVNLVRELADDFEEDRDWATYYPGFTVNKLKGSKNMQRFEKETQEFISKLIESK